MRARTRLGLVWIALCALGHGCGGSKSDPSSAEGGASSAGNGSQGANGDNNGGEGNNTASGGNGAVEADPSAVALAKRLGRDHFLIGVSGPDVPKTGQLDILYRYVVRGGNPAEAWPKWESPDGQYATSQINAAKAVGAIPMFTTYEFTGLGEGNIAGVADEAYMTFFWADMRLLAEKLKASDVPAIVHIEPDFWAYAQIQGGSDPSKVAAFVSNEGPCAGLPQDLTGLGRCVVRIFHTDSPKVVVGLHASVFAAYDQAGQPDGKAVGRYLHQVTGGEADFVATDVLDRDAGCFELQVDTDEYKCVREGSGWYWDETNKTSPNFHESFAWATSMHEGAIVPTLWWQVPMGVPSDTPGGTRGMYRDNRVRYFMSHIDELVKAGGVGVTFGAGAAGQTTQTTDGGQFEKALNAYNASPVLLK